MTKQTRATFLSALATLINDNVTGDVTPADVRTAITDLADSAAFIDDELEVEANNQTGTAYTLVLDDAWKQVRMDAAAANTLTVPPNAAVAFETGTVIWVEQAGAGTTTVVAGAGVTINTPDDLALVENQTVRLLKVGTDEWTMTDAVAVAAGGSAPTQTVATISGTSTTVSIPAGCTHFDMNSGPITVTGSGAAIVQTATSATTTNHNKMNSEHAGSTASAASEHTSDSTTSGNSVAAVSVTTSGTVFLSGRVNAPRDSGKRTTHQAWMT